MDGKQLAVYAAFFAGVFVMGWVALDGLGNLSKSDNVALAYAQDGRLQNTDANRQYYTRAAQLAGSECGNLDDVKNLQHLSHHPSQYAACLKLADPAKLKAAAGKTYQEIVGG